MNIRLETYLSGACYHARTIYLKGGKRVPVIDRTRRWRAAARAMRAAGKTDLQIAIALGRSRPAVAKALSFGWAF